MTATIMDGRALAKEVEEKLRQEAARLKSSGIEPTLATILVGDDLGSKVYVGSKHKAAERVGIPTVSHALSESTSAEELAHLIAQLNADRTISGILLQLPLPSHLDEREMIERLDPRKDVDGLTSANSGKLFQGASELVPCTPMGVMELLHRYHIKIASSSAVIIGRSTLVGKPLYHLLLAEDATVTTCHSKTADLASITSGADILVSAVGGRPDFVVTADMVKEGAVVVDVAINRVQGKLTGDVDFEGVSKKASYVTPVPGGVGPMTVVMLMRNTLIAASRSKGVPLPVVTSN
jgi:methylenetetrahydrofolate dehydrogenase (NADP+)/methenyltetrahydrofolate cyclohydrolase